MSRIVADPLIAESASLIGDPTRARMLGVLLDGRARTAKELASLANVSAPTASEHVSKMKAAGLVSIAAQGRHRYVRLAGPEIAEILERLMSLAATSRPTSAARGPEADAFRELRSCYDHIAGRLAVALIEALIARDLLRRDDNGFQPTPAGERWFAALDVNVEQARKSSRAFARCCLDWSERRDHLAGALGAELMEALIARGVIVRRKDGRTLDVTARGRKFFAEEISAPAERSAGAAHAGHEHADEQHAAERQDQ